MASSSIILVGRNFSLKKTVIKNFLLQFSIKLLKNYIPFESSFYAKSIAAKCIYFSCSGNLILIFKLLALSRKNQDGAVFSPVLLIFAAIVRP